MPEQEIAKEKGRIVSFSSDDIYIQGISCQDLIALGVDVFLKLNDEEATKVRKRELLENLREGKLLRPGAGWYGISVKDDHRFSDEKKEKPTLTVQLVNARGDKNSQEKMREVVEELLV